MPCDPADVGSSLSAQRFWAADGAQQRRALGGAGLLGTISPRLADLQSLQYLLLFNNHLSGAIPAELGQMTSLVGLQLFSNDLTGFIPPELGLLPNLQI
ncbi:hypothetical protein GOP47_0014527, partial [Adiantum capillus-veneris]